LENNKPNIVYLCSRFPYPLEKGDKLRAYHQIKALSEHFQVTLICTSTTNVSETDKAQISVFCSSIYVFKLTYAGLMLQLMWSLFSNLPFQVHYFYRFTHHRNIKKILKAVQPMHIFCQLIRMSEYVKNEHHIPKTLDYMDALSKGMERRIATESQYKKWFFRMESQRLKRYERQQFDYFEHKLIISEQDQQFILHPHYQQIVVIPNGIDESFFQHLNIEKQYELVFTGNFSYAPNIDAAVFLAEEVMPLLKQKINSIHLCLSGANPAKRVLKLASESIRVTGWVQDIRTSYQQAHLFVAPLFIGTGLQNKLLEAMASGIPCVTTDLVNNSLKAEAGKSILIATTATEFVDAILKLLQDEHLRNQVAVEGKAFVKTNFSWDEQGKRLTKLILNT
jgi:sugar transferase (PEP-CTERM/EpsH1 system associated)